MTNASFFSSMAFCSYSCSLEVKILKLPVWATDKRPVIYFYKKRLANISIEKEIKKINEQGSLTPLTLICVSEFLEQNYTLLKA